MKLSQSQNLLKIYPRLKPTICHTSKYQTATQGNLSGHRASVTSSQLLTLCSLHSILSSVCYSGGCCTSPLCVYSSSYIIDAVVLYTVDFPVEDPPWITDSPTKDCLFRVRGQRKMTRHGRHGNRKATLTQITTSYTHEELWTHMSKQTNCSTTGPTLSTTPVS